MAGATGAVFSPGSDIEILNNGTEFYPAMLEAIAQADVSINIEAYIYWSGKSVPNSPTSGWRITRSQSVSWQDIIDPPCAWLPELD